MFRLTAARHSQEALRARRHRLSGSATRLHPAYSSDFLR